jgi:predicted dinucleotide-binding enzyme
MIIGTGNIGRAIARLLHAVGMKVTGVGRTARDNDPDFGKVPSRRSREICGGDRPRYCRCTAHARNKGTN